MPQIGDILRVPLRFVDPDGGAVLNVFHFALDALQTNTWQAVADDIALWFSVGYNPWMDHVSTQWGSIAFDILVRDVANGQWDQVHSEDYSDLNGQVVSDSAPALAPATFISYPGLVRHWGFKNLPSPAETAKVNGRLDAAAFVDLLLTAALLSSGVNGADATLRVGVYSLATELFRGFTGTIAASNVIGSRVTRKVNEGI